MKNKKVKMKGLATPTIMVFMHGFFDGRFRATGLDQDSGLLNSAYVNGKTDMFYKYCSERVDRLETDIAAVCTDAEKLLLELKDMPEKIRKIRVTEEEPVKLPKKLPDSMEEAQLARADARKAAKAKVDAEQSKANKNQMETRKIEILQQLVMIRDRILNKETNCRNELSATSFALKERLCVYGHGVLLKPVLHRYIPQLEYEWAFDLYNKNHEEIKRRISEVVSKEGNENV
nr:hypothetical protein [uncultured Blautia sp.]